MNLPDDIQIVTKLPEPIIRPDNVHKGHFGHALIIAGSRGMSGAAIFAGMGALRGGAGLVTVAVPESVGAIVAGYEPSYMTKWLKESERGHIHPSNLERLLSRAEAATVVAIGPGLGLSTSTVEFVGEFIRNTTAALVIDADALNVLARLRSEPLLSRPSGAAPVIVTPHPGELARMLDSGVEHVQANREMLAVDYARKFNSVVVLKGAGTVITDGIELAINETGNSALATGGTGDVLTGMIAAEACQRIHPFDAARAAVHAHGKAAELAIERGFSPRSMIASDLVNFIGQVI